eukprot:PhF_6_TR28602/c0_g1_i1/m.42132
MRILEVDYSSRGKSLDSCFEALQGTLSLERPHLGTLPEMMLYALLGGQLGVAKRIISKADVFWVCYWLEGSYRNTHTVGWRRVAASLPSTADRLSVVEYILEVA